MTKEPEIILDGNGLRHLRDWLDAKEAKRILLLTGPSRRYADRVALILEGLQVEIFSGAKVHVPRPVVERVLSKHPELTVSWVSDALLGTNPSIYVERTE